MSILKVARLGHPVVRTPAALVPTDEIATSGFQRLVDDMIETMREYDGVGLAAPQVHVSLRLAVLEVAANPRYPAAPEVPLTVLVNPEVEDLGPETAEDWEGCLSIPDLRGRVPRAHRIRLRAFARDGRPFEVDVEGFHARVVQHECDHLGGRVYVDRMSDMSSLSHIAEWLRFGR